MKLPFKKIDAFATEKSSGNPAGYILLNSIDEISASDMLMVAKELQGYVNEVGYVARMTGNVFEFKYYSAEREVDFCGHATIAIMYDLIKNNPDLMELGEIKIIANGETLIVQNKIKEEDAVFIMAPSPKYTQSLISKAELAKALMCDANNIVAQPEIINAGLETLIINIGTLETILGLKPQLASLNDFCIKNAIDIIEVFCEKTSNLTNSYRTRVFAPTFGYLEDPATGSGNSAFANYLLKHNKWDGETISIEQNGEADNYNIVKLTTCDYNNAKRVLFGGRAITRIVGNYFI